MSIATWKKEFYGSLKEGSRSDVKALKHGIRKWTGLLPSNMKKHKVKRSLGIEKTFISDGSIGFEIDGSSCALCRRHFYLDCCGKCPINDCCSARGPYTIWYNKNDPRPMIRALKKALKEREK
jgi:hypothetical protein